MDEIIIILFASVALIGALGTYLQQDPFKKLISIGIIYGGVIPFVVDRGYLDVAIVVSLIIPTSTIIILPLMRRDIRDA